MRTKRLVHYDDKVKRDKWSSARGQFAMNYLRDGMTIKEIAQKHSCPKKMVIEQLEKQNCQLREIDNKEYKVRNLDEEENINKKGNYAPPSHRRNPWL